MNLENYQQFKQAYHFFFKDPRSKVNTQNAYKMLGMDKEEFYKTSNLKTEEEIQRHETARTERLVESIEYGLQTAQVFDVDKVTKRLLMLTEAPTRKDIIQHLKLPFPCMFFDLKLESDELPENMYFSENIIRMEGLMVMKSRDVVWKNDHEGSIDEEVYCVALYSGPMGSFFEDCVFPLSNTTKVWYHDMSNVIVVKSLLCNLLMLMEHPDVEFRTFTRSQKNRERRIRNHEMPLPDHNVVVLKGKLIRYINEHRSILEGVGFDHSFWVRGHWRMHRADRYKTMKGRVIWIEPYLKGKGALKQKTYSIQPTKEEEKEYHDGFLWLDDIEPLEKPLSEMTDKQKNRVRRLA
jgi:hypothetical protein